MLSGTVFDIQRFSIHDGPGIRTTVFVKGCPLSCLWCHNPESIESQPEIAFLAEKCIGCGYCFKTCPKGCHVMENEQHVLHRDTCERCGRCTLECYAQALELIGKEMTVDEVIDTVLRDQPFYETSNGGMTLSGGEPLTQFDFTKALLDRARTEGLHTCVETSGFAPRERVLELVPWVDLFLWDYKETDPAKHEEYTGAPPDAILANLQAIDDAGAAIILRCPVIPGLNDRPDHFEGIASTATALTNVQEIQLEPYHPLGKSKSERIGKPYALGDQPFAEDPDIDAWIVAVQKHTAVPVRRI